MDVVQTLACSLILSRIDYCNAVLHGAPSGIIHKLQRVENNVARIVHEAPRRSLAYPLLKKLHWLPVEQRISYKLALLMFKIRQTSAPAYLSQHIARSGTRSLRSSDVPLLHVPFRRTAIGKRSTTWNSLPASVINCDTLSVFKSKLKTRLFNFAYS